MFFFHLHTIDNLFKNQISLRILIKTSSLLLVFFYSGNFEMQQESNDANVP